MPKGFKGKNSMREGLAYLMNDVITNLATPQGKQAFAAMNNASGLSISETLKHIGNRSRAPAPTDAEKSKARLNKLEGE